MLNKLTTSEENILILLKNEDNTNVFVEEIERLIDLGYAEWKIKHKKGCFPVISEKGKIYLEQINK